MVVRVPSEGPLPSTYWKAHFRRSQDNPPIIPWETASALAPQDADTIRASIQEFQLGEQAEGRHLIRSAREHAAHTGDWDYHEAMQLFIREEQGHAAMLGRFMDLAGIPRIKRSASDSIFRALRKLAGLETSICVLVSAEIIAKVYYRGLRDATACTALRVLCDRILEDEAGHVRFQCERVGVLRRGRAKLLSTLAALLQRVLFAGACAAVWSRHHRVLRAGGFSLPSFWRLSHEELEAGLGMIERLRQPLSEPL